MNQRARFSKNFLPKLPGSGFANRNLEFSHEIGLVATPFVDQIEFAVGTANLIMIGFNPVHDSLVSPTQAAKAAVVDDGSDSVIAR